MSPQQVSGRARALVCGVFGYLLTFRAPVTLTRLIAPYMLEHFTRTHERSLILNMGSFSFLGAPLLGHYAGTKAYVDSLSKSLRADYMDRGIDVVVLHPAMVATRLSSIRTGSFLFPSPKKYGFWCRLVIVACFRLRVWLSVCFLL